MVVEFSLLPLLLLLLLEGMKCIIHIYLDRTMGMEGGIGMRSWLKKRMIMMIFLIATRWSSG